MKEKREFFSWPRPFTVDLNNPKHRWRIFYAFLGLVVVGLALLTGGIEGYLYTESVPFCGTTCHSMYVNLDRYQQSPHTNVACAECHVGPGVQAFIESKIVGTRQMIHTLTNNVEKPIKSPVTNLRPARETCETCHTPTSFKDNITKIIKHYADDKANTLEQTTFILKLGGINSVTGQGKGVHWHTSGEVYYIPLDAQRQKIGWVAVKQPDGSLKEFFASDLVGMGQKEFVAKARATNQVRLLDCIDCHNRTAHYIPYPAKAVDDAITNGLIPQSLPYIRKQAVSLLDQQYSSVDQANKAIDELGASYQGNPDASQADVAKAVKSLKDVFSETNFPDMKADWRTNPNNLGHTPTLGCFRCHDGKHIYTAPDGKTETISVECNLCHTVPIKSVGAETVVQAPVIVGDVPASHVDFSWTITHQTVTDADKQQCYQCHGEGFCNNGACHNLQHPTNMAFTHPQEVARVGQQVCFTCHQDITCTKCHPTGVRDINQP